MADGHHPTTQEAYVPGNDYQYDVLRTYRYVRLAMVLLVVMLGVGVAIEVAREGWLPSISDAYYTPARAAFVGCLCAIGTCLIVYRGNTDAEDAVLNGSGFLAFLVAFVPVRREDACSVRTVPDDVVAAISTNVPALLVTGLLALATTLAIERLTTRDPVQPRGRANTALIAASVLAFALLGASFLIAPDSFRCHGHNLSAILLFIGIVVVVALNGLGLARKQAARDHDRPRDHRWNRYVIGFGAMVASIVVVVVGGAWQGWIPNWVFWLEGALITQFALFWITQTAELWREPKRGETVAPRK